VIRFRRGSVKLGIERGSYATVEASDVRHEQLTIRTDKGAAIVYTLQRLRGVEVFRPESRTLSVGDRIQFRAPDHALKIANGEFATIAAIDERQTRLGMHDGRELKAATARLRHIDHGYASTSHSSQGATVDRVIVNIDATRSVKLVNQRQFYVSISRARNDARIYTDDTNALARVVGRDQLKPTALEHLSVAQRANSRNYNAVEVEDPAPTRLKQGIRQERKLEQGRGIRW
jgi:ATP-dependent exoDNAse (exonuclease V) alpha subunit